MSMTSFFILVPCIILSRVLNCRMGPLPPNNNATVTDNTNLKTLYYSYLSWHWGIITRTCQGQPRTFLRGETSLLLPVDHGPRKETLIVGSTLWVPQIKLQSIASGSACCTYPPPVLLLGKRQRCPGRHICVYQGRGEWTGRKI